VPAGTAVLVVDHLVHADRRLAARREQRGTHRRRRRVVVRARRIDHPGVDHLRVDRPVHDAGVLRRVVVRARRRRALRERVQERLEIDRILVGDVERHDPRIAVLRELSGVAPAAVERDHVGELGVLAVVHVRPRDRDLAQRAGEELPGVGAVLRDLGAPAIDRLHAAVGLLHGALLDAGVVKAEVGQERTVVALDAAAAPGEHREAALLAVGQRIALTVEVVVERSVAGGELGEVSFEQELDVREDQLVVVRHRTVEGAVLGAVRAAVPDRLPELGEAVGAVADEVGGIGGRSPHRLHERELEDLSGGRVLATPREHLGAVRAHPLRAEVEQGHRVAFRRAQCTHRDVVRRADVDPRGERVVTALARHRVVDGERAVDEQVLRKRQTIGAGRGAAPREPARIGRRFQPQVLQLRPLLLRERAVDQRIGRPAATPRDHRDPRHAYPHRPRET